MADIDRLIHALIEAQADPTEEAITRCLGMARAMRDQPVRGRGGWLRAMRKSAGLTMWRMLYEVEHPPFGRGAQMRELYDRVATRYGAAFAAAGREARAMIDVLGMWPKEEA